MLMIFPVYLADKYSLEHKLHLITSADLISSSQNHHSVKTPTNKVDSNLLKKTMFTLFLLVEYI